MVGAMTAFNVRLALGAAIFFVLFAVILPDPKRGLYLLAATLPFEQLTSLGQSFSLLRLIMIVIFVSWLVRLLRSGGSFAHLWSARNFSLAIFLAVATLSLTQAQDLHLGIYHLTTFAQLAIFFLVVQELVEDKETIVKIMEIWVVSASLSAIIPLAQMALDFGVRPVGAYGEPGKSALNIVVLVPLVLVMFSLRTGYRKALYLTAFLLLAGGTVATLSRGPMIVLVFLVLIMAGNRFLDRRTRAALISILLVMVLCVPLLSQIDRRISFEYTKKDKAAGRFELWSTGENIFYDHWMLGVGFGNFRGAYIDYASHDPLIEPSRVVAIVAHNLYIQEAVETGFLGILTFLSFLALLIRHLWSAQQAAAANNNRRDALIVSMLLVSIIGLLLGSVSYSTLTMKMPWLLFALASSYATFTLNENQRA